MLVKWPRNRVFWGILLINRMESEGNLQRNNPVNRAFLSDLLGLLPKISSSENMTDAVFFTVLSCVLFINYSGIKVTDKDKLFLNKSIKRASLSHGLRSFIFHFTLVCRSVAVALTKLYIASHLKFTHLGPLN